MYFCFFAGDTEVFYWQEESSDPEEARKLFHIATEKLDEHEDEITCVDSIPQLGMYITGSKDGTVKVWNKLKEMLREIKFPEAINSVIFVNPKADILIGHGGKVSRVLAEDYKPLENLKLHSEQA